MTNIDSGFLGMKNRFHYIFIPNHISSMCSCSKFFLVIFRSKILDVKISGPSIEDNMSGGNINNQFLW